MNGRSKWKQDAVGTDVNIGLFVGFGFPPLLLDSFHEWSVAFLAVVHKFTCVRELHHRKYDELDGAAAN